jgi:hypothetical protein
LLAEGVTWLTYAYRPLRITELQHVLQFGETFDNDEIADKETILSVCCGLVVTDRESQIVHLVREYAFGYLCLAKD